MRKDKRPTPRSGRGRPLCQGEHTPMVGGPVHPLTKGARQGAIAGVRCTVPVRDLPPIVAE
jgi:hypothetical protein